MSNQTPIEVRIVRLPHARDLPLPQYQSALAAGLDLLAAVPADAPVEIPPGGRAVIPTGVAIALPPGSEGQIRPRSGLAARHGVTVLNTPGNDRRRLPGRIAGYPGQYWCRIIRRFARHAHRPASHRANSTCKTC